jgi:hypothetical protein
MDVPKVNIIIIIAAISGALSCRMARGGGEDASTTMSAELNAVEKDSSGKIAKGNGSKLKTNQTQVYSWTESPGISWRYSNSRMQWEEASEYCKELSNATKKRWRLPSAIEVQSAIKDGISTSKNQSFGWIYLHQVWTSIWETTQGKKVAVYVDASDGNALRTSVDHELSTLCVNTTTSSGRSDLWTDEKSNLIWRDLGEQVDRWGLETRCLDIARGEKLPWRVATATELETAVKNGIQTAANPAFGQNYLTVTWASDRALTFGQDGLAIDLRNGNRYVVGHNQALVGLCVRPRYH